ncbi:MAG: hypothetical protein AB7O59_16330 [Pirellulales bacterium]
MAALVAGTLTAGALADSHDEQLLDGLRRRGLYELAEKYCTDRLADRELPIARRAVLAAELARSYADQAVQSAPEQRAPLWQKARRAVADFTAAHGKDPRTLAVRMQGALVTLAEGEAALDEVEAGGGATQAGGSASDTLRSAVGELRKLDQDINAELQVRARPARRETPGEVSTAELSSLLLHVRHQLARGLRDQALCYASTSADRVNSLGQAIELLAELARHELTLDLAWQVRADEIACLRLAGQLNDAVRKLTDAQKNNPPAAIQPRLREERIRLALAAGRVDEALAETGPADRAAASGAADLELAQLDAYIAAWRQARQRGDAAGVRKFEKAAADHVRAMQQGADPAAARRAETVLARSIVHTAGSQDPQVLLLAAQSLHRNGKLDEAVAAYDDVAKRAAAAGDKKTAFESRYAAGVLEYERQRSRQALDRLAGLALEMPDQPQAAAAHLLAIHSAGQLAQQHSPPQLDEYQRLLREHLEHWPEGPTASQAWWSLGRLAEHGGAWQEAIRALKNVRPDFPQYPQAVAAIGRSYEQALAALRDRGNSHELLAQDALRYLESVTGGRGKSPVPADVRRSATLAAARIYLLEMPQGGAKARQLLQTALDGDPQAPADWVRSASALLVPALAADGQYAAAEKQLQQTSIGSAAESLALVEMLTGVSQRAASSDKRGVARLELTAIGDALARRSDLDAAAVKQLTRRQAAVHAELNDPQAALTVLRELARQYPRDGEVQEDLARALAASGDAESRQAALVKWRDVAAHCRPGSERWFRAQFALARLQFDLGHPEQARATIKLVAAGQPEMGGAEMRARFRQLLAECDQAPAARAKKE